MTSSTSGLFSLEKDVLVWLVWPYSNDLYGWTGVTARTTGRGQLTGFSDEVQIEVSLDGSVRPDGFKQDPFFWPMEYLTVIHEEDAAKLEGEYELDE